jgi:hypothetical protein
MWDRLRQKTISRYCPFNAHKKADLHLREYFQNFLRY